MSIKDRGNIKWTSLMLVEHKKRLEELKEEEQEREKPELDEQELRKLDQILHRALEKKLKIKIIYYEEKRYSSIEGIIEKCLPETGEIVVRASGDRIYLSAKDILNIELI